MKHSGRGILDIGLGLAFRKNSHCSPVSCRTAFTRPSGRIRCGRAHTFSGRCSPVLVNGCAMDFQVGGGHISRRFTIGNLGFAGTGRHCKRLCGLGANRVSRGGKTAILAGIDCGLRF